MLRADAAMNFRREIGLALWCMLFQFCFSQRSTKEKNHLFDAQTESLRGFKRDVYTFSCRKTSQK
jgi:hypothetical protein